MRATDGSDAQDRAAATPAPDTDVTVIRAAVPGGPRRSANPRSHRSTRACRPLRSKIITVDDMIAGTVDGEDYNAGGYDALCELTATIDIVER